MAEIREFSFRVIADLTLENKVGEKTSKPKESSVSLETSNNLVRSKYVNEEGITEEGLKPAILTLLSGLASVIIIAEQRGWTTYEDMAEYMSDYLDEMISKAKSASVGIMDNDKFIDPKTEMN